MKLISNTYRHNSNEFSVLVTTKRLDNGEVVKFNRAKFEYMLNKGVFTRVEIVE